MTTRHMARPLHQWPNTVGILQISFRNNPNQSLFGPNTKNPKEEGNFDCILGFSYIVLKLPLKTIPGPLDLVQTQLLKILSYTYFKIKALLK